MAHSGALRCRDCGTVIAPGQATPDAVSHRGGYGRRRRADLCPGCRANRERWEGRVRGVGGLLTLGLIAYAALRASGVV